MVLLELRPNFIKDLKTFKWGKEWRAERIWRELRIDGEYLFASIKKDYGVIEGTHALDLGNKKEDYYWVGRTIRIVGERVPDTDPNSPTFGKRVYKAPPKRLGREWNENTKQWEDVTYEDGRKTYDYICPATPENLKLFQTMAGPLDNNNETQLIFIYGSRNIDVPDADLFFKTGDVVKDFQDEENKRAAQDPQETQAELIAKILKETRAQK